MNEPTLEDLKMRSSKALDIMIGLFFVLLFGGSAFLFYFNNTIDNETRLITDSYIKQLSSVSQTEIETYMISMVSNCMQNKRRHIVMTNIHGFTLDSSLFKNDMQSAKNSCLNSLQDDAELLNSRGGVSGGSDIKFAEKVKALMATQAL